MPKYMLLGRKSANNRKETRGRSVRKQYAPLYSKKELEKMAAEVDKNGNKKYPSYYIEQLSRRKKLILHEAA